MQRPRWLNVLDIVFQTHLDLGNDRYVTLQEYKGKSLVHIRQFTRFGDKIYPSPTGIHLSGEQFKNLLDIINDIDSDVRDFREKKVDSFKFHLGDNVYVSASKDYPVIHVRRYFQNELMPFALPTKTGIPLRLAEWDKLVVLMNGVKKIIANE